MYVLIERNNDGCFFDTCLVSASDSRYEIEQALVSRWKEAIVEYSEWRGCGFDKNDRTYIHLNPSEGYASFGYDCDGEMIELYVFDTNEPDTTF